MTSEESTSSERNEIRAAKDASQPDQSVRSGFDDRDAERQDTQPGNELLTPLSSLQDQITVVLDKVVRVEKAIASLQSSSMTDTMLSQILTVSRETLVKASVPAQLPADVLEPVLRDLIGLVFNVDELLRAQSSSTLEALRGFVVEIAERYGVEFFAPPVGEQFSAVTAHAIGTDPTTQRGEEGQVTRIVRPGCRLSGKLLFYPQVRVSKLSV